jgi:hypothetical protein
MRQAKMIEQPSDLWELERYLTERRKEIDSRYDYRYSVLLNVRNPGRPVVTSDN